MKIKWSLLLALPLLFFCTTLLAEHSGEHDSARNFSSIEQRALAPLRALLSEFKQADFLAVDDAFQLEITAPTSNHLTASFTVADGYYLYRDKIKIHRQSDGDGELRAVEIALPPGEIKQDAYFGETAVLKRNFTAPIVLQRQSPAAIEATLHATYQGCAEQGICYAPVTKTFPLRLPQIITSALAAHETENPPRISTATATATTEFSNGFAKSNSISLLFGAFVAGLLLTFTPCVLPMLPILSSVIAARATQTANPTNPTPKQSKTPALAASLSTSLSASLSYVLGTMLSYTAIGALAGASGAHLQSYFQNIWAIGFLCAVLVAMALSMFGLFKIQLPTSLQTKLHNQAGRMTGSLPLIFALGAMSAVVVGACVSPILISLLGLAIAGGDAWLGAQMMFALALGMGVPLLALGVGAGYLIPKAGRWTASVNRIFGVLLLAVAIYLLGALPAVPVLLLWGVLLSLVGLRLLTAPPSQPQRARGWQLCRQAIGVLILLWGAAALLGWFNGERDLFKPLPATLFSTVAQPDAPPRAEIFTPVRNETELNQQFARAKAENKWVMVEYYADWCVDCVRMEKTTFRDAQVAAILRAHFVALKIDVTNPRDADGKLLKKRFAVLGPPAFLFFNRNGAELKDKHFYGYRNRADFLALLADLQQSGSG